MEIAPLSYYWAKIKYAPWSDLPLYGWSFLANRIAMARSNEKRMRIWGPRFADMDAIRDGGASLDALCATQWVRCVEGADTALTALPDDKTLTLKYEAVTMDPALALDKITRFLGICLLYTSPSPRDLSTSRMPSSA